MNKKGFTLIEVSLVFGLAALIFLMAFIALPSLWISQRDAARKSNIMTLISDLKVYQTNNSRGALPTGTSDNFTLKDGQANANKGKDNWRGFIRDYVAMDFADPNTNVEKTNLVFNVSACSPVTAGSTCNNVAANNGASPNFNKDTQTIYILIGATCDGDHAVKANGERSAAIIQVLERGGRYCHST